MTKAKLVIMRHGQTEHNIKRLLTGQMDVPLTQLGEAQARAAGPLLRDIPFDKVYSSPLSRAFNTVTLALEAAGQEIPIEQRNEILEADAGEYSGRSLNTDPAVAEFLKLYIYDAAPPGGESDKQVVERVRKFFDEEVQPRLARGENVLISAHAETIRSLDIVLGLVPTPADGVARSKRRHVPNAGPAVHEYEDGVLKKSYALENPETAKADAAYKSKKAAAERAGTKKILGI